MNKVVNSLSVLLMLVYAFLALGSIYDLNFSTYNLRSLPFLNEIVIGVTITVLLLGVIRIRRRWTGLSDIKSFKRFVYTTKLSKKAFGMGTMFLLVEFAFMVFFILLSLDAQKTTEGMLLYPMFGVLSVLSLETLFYIFKFRTSNEIKLGVNKNLVAYFDREMHIYYFDGLQQVSVYQNRLHFKYKTDLNMFMELDIIPKDQLTNFKSALHSVLENKDVFFAESFREIGTNVNP